jgi:hypothetical protein
LAQDSWIWEAFVLYLWIYLLCIENV